MDEIHTLVDSFKFNLFNQITFCQSEIQSSDQLFIFFYLNGNFKTLKFYAMIRLTRLNTPSYMSSMYSKFFFTFSKLTSIFFILKTNQMRIFLTFKSLLFKTVLLNLIKQKVHYIEVVGSDPPLRRLFLYAPK